MNEQLLLDLIIAVGIIAWLADTLELEFYNKLFPSKEQRENIPNCLFWIIICQFAVLMAKENNEPLPINVVLRLVQLLILAMNLVESFRK